MKRKENKKAVNRVKKAIALFGKLSGLGVVGFNDHRSEKKDEQEFPIDEIFIVQNKTVKSPISRQHQESCYTPFNCQPGNYPICRAAIDLWYY